jgi:hypothetical protein
MNNSKKYLNALHEKDIEIFLDKIRLKNEFYNNKIKCNFCNQTIGIKNIYSFFRENNLINSVCDRSECITKFINKINNKIY